MTYYRHVRLFAAFPLLSSVQAPWLLSFFKYVKHIILYGHYTLWSALTEHSACLAVLPDFHLWKFFIFFTCTQIPYSKQGLLLVSLLQKQNETKQSEKNTPQNSISHNLCAPVFHFFYVLVKLYLYFQNNHYK